MNRQVELERKAKVFAARIIRLPFVRMVVLTGSVAAGRATQTSDIDFLIVTKSGRIYLARAIVVIMANIWGEYRSSQNIAGKLCLNWFIAAPNRANFQFSIYNFQSIFNLQFSKQIDKKRIGDVKLLSQRNKQSWLEELLSGELGDYLERLAKSYQIARFQKDPRTHMGGSEVRWSDDEIGLHPPK